MPFQKIIYAFFAALVIVIFAAGYKNSLIYQVEPNHGDFPLPYELPAIDDSKADKFYWQRYLESSKSDADRAFRAQFAKTGYAQPLAVGGQSTMEEYHRATLGTGEFSRQCDELARRYQLKLQSEPELLEELNQYITYHREAINLQVK